jgi:hypothetical protein
LAVEFQWRSLNERDHPRGGSVCAQRNTLAPALAPVGSESRDSRVAKLGESVAFRPGVSLSENRDAHALLINTPPASQLPLTRPDGHPLPQSGTTPIVRREPVTAGSGERVFTGARLILVLALIVAFAGCEGPDGPALTFSSVRYRSMPAADRRIPAPRGVGMAHENRLILLDSIGRVILFNPDGKLYRMWYMPAYDVGRPEGAIRTITASSTSMVTARSCRCMASWAAARGSSSTR